MFSLKVQNEGGKEVIIEHQEWPGEIIFILKLKAHGLRNTFGSLVKCFLNNNKIKFNHQLVTNSISVFNCINKFKYNLTHHTCKCTFTKWNRETYHLYGWLLRYNFLIFIIIIPRGAPLRVMSWAHASVEIFKLLSKLCQ